MDPPAQREFVQNRHYGNLGKFSGGRSCSDQDSMFAGLCHTCRHPRGHRLLHCCSMGNIKKIHGERDRLKAEAKVLGQPRILQIHERQAVHMVSQAMLIVSHRTTDSLKAKQRAYRSTVGQNSDQSAVDNTGHIRVTRTKAKATMPTTTEV